MNQIIIRNDQGKANACRTIQALKLDKPVEVSFRDYNPKRSMPQNDISHAWYAEAAKTLRDDTANGIRAYCKLHYGIPILRADDAEFKEKYDRIIRDMPYAQKLELMAEPFDFPVTRLMNKAQMKTYLDSVYVYLTGRGVMLEAI